MKRIKIFLILLVIAMILGTLTYCVRSYFKNLGIKEELETKKSNEVFVQKALDEFNKSASIKPSKVAQNLVDEFNSKTKNHYDSKKQAYTFEKNCSACTSVEYDDDIRTIIITTYNKKGELTQRTIINPPSFVTYTK